MQDSMRETDEKDLWWSPECYDNLLFDRSHNEDRGQRLPLSPTIMIHEAEEHECPIATAEIESCFDRNLTPEGNVKYRNYKVLAPSNVPIRVYTPSGDINVTPTKGKTVPKFDLFDDFSQTRERLYGLISDHSTHSQVLKDIIRPPGVRHVVVAATLEVLRRNNASSAADDYARFLRTVDLYSPSPSCFSTFSDDEHGGGGRQQHCYSAVDPQLLMIHSPPATPDYGRSRRLFKSQSTDDGEGGDAMTTTAMRQKLGIVRQASVPCDGVNRGMMCLSDELHQANRKYLRSHTPRGMMHVDYRPVSSLSENVYGRTTPLDSKKSLLRSFVQRNMIVNAVDRNDLARLALAIEEDDEQAENCSSFANSTRVLERKVQAMLDEVRELKETVMDIAEDIDTSDSLVANLLVQAKGLSEELDVVHYLDDIITLLNGETDVIRFRSWPFLFPNRKRDANANLVI